MNIRSASTRVQRFNQIEKWSMLIKLWFKVTQVFYTLLQEEWLKIVFSLSAFTKVNRLEIKTIIKQT